MSEENWQPDEPGASGRDWATCVHFVQAPPEPEPNIDWSVKQESATITTAP